MAVDKSKIPFVGLGDLLTKYDLGEPKQKRISQEFQDYAYRLALELDDKAHTMIYMRMAKKHPRAMLEQAKNFVMGATNAKDKGKLFMWKIKKMREEEKETDKMK